MRLVARPQAGRAAATATPPGFSGDERRRGLKPRPAPCRRRQAGPYPPQYAAFEFCFHKETLSQRNVFFTNDQQSQAGPYPPQYAAAMLLLADELQVRPSCCCRSSLAHKCALLCFHYRRLRAAIDCQVRLAFINVPLPTNVHFCASIACCD